MPEFLNPWMLLGLAALAIPIIVHLLNRRRYDVVDWGAMQFLQVSKVTRRRLFLEEILLMLLRMGLLALLVFALAAMRTDYDLLAKLEPRPKHDVVLVFDGSLSMNYAGPGGKTADQAAREWAADYLTRLTPGDAVAVIQAKQQPIAVVPAPSRDLTKYVPDKIRDLSHPSGGCDWPAALAVAAEALSKSERSEKDVIFLTDGQRAGWADGPTLRRWEPLGAKLNGGKNGGPRLWVVNVDPDRPADPPNWSLSPLRVNRPVVPVKREVTFRGDLEVRGDQAYTPPYGLRLEVDGKFVRALKPPAVTAVEKGKAPFSFTHAFADAGSHLVSVVVEPDPPGQSVKDRVPDDNRTDFAVEVTPALPVLIVDGDPDPAAPKRGAFSLRDALAPKRDPAPSVKATVVSIDEFTPALLSGDEDRPRVLILADVAAFSKVQRDAVDQFLADGGGVLAAVGKRADADEFNKQLYRDGKGWLPGRLAGVEGDETKIKEAARPTAVSATHPSVELFRGEPVGGLAAAYFPRWWKLDASRKEDDGVTVALMRSPTAEYPFVVEKTYKAGRILLCAVPLDGSWGTNLPDLPAFVPLAHELVYYLAGARSAEFNLEAGQPIRCRLASDAAATGFTLQPPGGKTKPLVIGPPGDDSYYAAELSRQSRGSLLVYGDTKEPGVYRLTTPDDRVVYYVVQPDPAESDLTACTADDRDKVAALVPVHYENDRDAILDARTAADHKQEWWWWVFLLGLLALLCGEVFMTRRMLRGG
jgi:hypothetical protein